mgnify:CR=1 FL=1
METIKEFLKNNKYQAYSIEILVALYRKYRKEKDEGLAPDIDVFFKAFNYPIENALFSHYAVWLNNKGSMVSIEYITRRKVGKPKNVALTRKAREALEKYYSDRKKQEKKDVNKYIHWEHITPKSICYQKLKEVFDGPKTLSVEELKEKLIREVLYKNKIVIMAKEESALLDNKPEKWADEYRSKIENENVKLLRPFMYKKAEALTRLYYLSLFNIEITFDNGETYYKILDLIDIQNTPLDIKECGYLSDEQLGISAKNQLLEYFENYFYPEID